MTAACARCGSICLPVSRCRSAIVLRSRGSAMATDSRPPATAKPTSTCALAKSSLIRRSALASMLVTLRSVKPTPHFWASCASTNASGMRARSVRARRAEILRRRDAWHAASKSAVLTRSSSSTSSSRSSLSWMARSVIGAPCLRAPLRFARPASPAPHWI
jgi:hypothetical protein